MAMRPKKGKPVRGGPPVRVNRLGEPAALDSILDCMDGVSFEAALGRLDTELGFRQGFLARRFTEMFSRPARGES
jgi:hypothetical protein